MFNGFSVAEELLVLGDSNFDGKVTLQDYYNLRDHYGTGQRLTEGDFDGDIDIDDYFILRDEYPFHNGGRSLVSGIPEPVSLLLLAMGGVVSLGYRQK